MHPRQFVALPALVVVLAATWLVSATLGTAAPSPWMYDESSYDVLTYSVWGRQNHVSGAQCTGLGRGRKGFEGMTHASFRCHVQVGGAPAGVVVAKVIGPESLRVVSVAGGKLMGDRGIGPVPKGTPALAAFEAVIALQNGSWGKTHRISRALCYGVGPYRDRGVASPLFFSFSCATFDQREARAAQVLVTATGKKAVRVVRTLAR